MTRRLRPILLALSLAVACAPQQPLELPFVAADPTLVRDFTSTTSCTETSPRRGRVRLVWRAAARASGKQRVDVTVYKGGFERDAFATLWPLESGRAFHAAGAGLPNRPDQQMLLLTVTALETSSSGQITAVVLEGLRPGVNYFWRVSTLGPGGWAPGAFGVSPGPICPDDSPALVIRR